MKKLLLIMCAVLSFFLLSIISASADELCECVGKTGRSRYVDVTEDCRLWETKVCWNTEGPAGPPGSQGEVGPEGPAGSQGPQGIQGIEGPIGSKGDTGETGPQGETGPMGPAGTQGPQGEQGIKGDKGDNGDQGDTGPAGVNGQDGADGAGCPITIEEFDDLIARIEYLEDNIVRFKDMYDGTIKDNKTGLIWLKNANAFGRMSWDEAMDTATALNDGEHGLTDGSIDGDWRLPTIAEWSEFFDTDYSNPALCNATGVTIWMEGDIFTGVQSSVYWSINEQSSNVTRSWCASMAIGSVGTNGKVANLYVWPVRSGN